MDDGANPPLPSKKISADERARRQIAVDYGRATVRLEGFVISAFAEEMNRRYVAGEITSRELTDSILTHHRV